MPDSIGLFGGTFDPVHNGHIAIARSFLSTGRISELWILLTPYPPHKVSKDHVSYDLRLEMLKAAFDGFNGVTISTIERELPQPSYSLNTIQHLKAKHSDKEFYFCMGEDSLATFNTWNGYEDILNEVRLMVAYRPGIDHSKVEKNILNRTQFVDHVPVAVSSSLVRERVQEGGNLFELLPERVVDIIERESLYK